MEDVKEQKVEESPTINVDTPTEIEKGKADEKAKKDEKPAEEEEEEEGEEDDDLDDYISKLEEKHA